MNHPSLYDTDFLTWAEEQAAALRALAGRCDLPNALDLENVVEEIEALGRNELKAATNPIRLILEHLLKIAFDPEPDAERHWRGEIMSWHADVLEELLPSMHRKIEMDGLWRYAMRRARGPLQVRGIDPPGLCRSPVRSRCKISSRPNSTSTRPLPGFVNLRANPRSASPRSGRKA